MAGLIVSLESRHGYENRRRSGVLLHDEVNVYEIHLHHTMQLRDRDALENRESLRDWHGLESQARAWKPKALPLFHAHRLENRQVDFNPVRLTFAR
jgi:hypothetical protein